MNDSFYPFRLGDLPCAALSDGSMDYPLQSFFANAPLAQVEAALRERGLPVDHIRTPYTYLYVDTGAHRVLVDMGLGNLSPHTGKLADNMRAAGIDPLSIDTVLITHAHGDHIGGAVDGAGKLVYANAHYYLGRESRISGPPRLRWPRHPSLTSGSHGRGWRSFRIGSSPSIARRRFSPASAFFRHRDTRRATWW
jgi:ribonuclease BN (tRNA processing enzyme)